MDREYIRPAQLRNIESSMIYGRDVQMRGYRPFLHMSAGLSSKEKYTSMQRTPTSKYKGLNDKTCRQPHRSQDGLQLLPRPAINKRQAGIQEAAKSTLRRSRHDTNSRRFDAQKAASRPKTAKQSKGWPPTPPLTPPHEVGVRQEGTGTAAWETVKQLALEFEGQTRNESGLPQTPPDRIGSTQRTKSTITRAWRSAVRRGSSSVRRVFGMRDILTARGVEEIVPCDSRKGVVWDKTSTEVQVPTARTKPMEERGRRDSGVDFDVGEKEMTATYASSMDSTFTAIIAKATKEESAGEARVSLPSAPPIAMMSKGRKSGRQSGDFPAQKRKPLSLVNPRYPQAPIHTPPVSPLPPPRPPPPPATAASIHRYMNKPLPTPPVTPPSSLRVQEKTTAHPSLASTSSPESASVQKLKFETFVGEDGRIGIFTRWKFRDERVEEKMSGCLEQYCDYDGGEGAVEDMPVSLRGDGGWYL